MIGYTTGITPSLTLGSGGVGGAITGDNIEVHHLFNLKRLAFETSLPPAEALRPGRVPSGSIQAPDYDALENMVREAVQEILQTK
jgi:acetaldehyde dehydrogenase (acetylating)